MPDNSTKLKNIKNLSFEEALNELESLANEMEDSDSALEKSIENFEYGTALKKHLEEKLKSAKLTIQKISESD